MRNKYYWLFRSSVLQVIFVILASILIVFAHSLYLDRKKELQESIQNNLKAIAELKSTEIHTWLQERLADASVLSHRNFYPDLSVFDNKKSDKFERLKERMNIVLSHYGYDNIILLDREMEVILSTNLAITRISDTVKEMLRSKPDEQSYFKLYNSADDQKIILDFYSAILSDRGEVLGYLILRCDPFQYLYPTVDRWPITTKTAETLLVERCGDSVRAVNDTKFMPIAALKSTVSVNHPENPAVHAVLEKSQLFEGTDGRNIPVLAYWIPVQGTDWKLIAMVEREELFEPLRSQAWAFSIILAVLLLFIGAVLLLIRTLFKRSHLKSLYDSELEHKMLVSHFDYLIKNANDIILLANDKGEIIEANDAALRTYRISREAMLGSPLSRLGEFRNPASKGSGSNIYEAIHYRTDRTSFPVEINEQITVVEGRKFFQAIIRDITDRKAAEEELRKFRTISDNANYGNVISDMNGILLYSNDCFARMHGYQVSEIVGRNLSMLHTEEQLPKVVETLSLLKSKGEFHTEEIWRRRKDGSLFPSMMNALIIFSDQYIPLFMSATVIDITDRKNAEYALRESEERLNFAQEIAKMGNWSLDMATNKVKWSRNYYRILGLDPSSEVEENEYFKKIMHPDDLHLLDEKLVEIYQTREAVDYDFRILMPDGTTKWLRCIIVPLFEGDKLITLEGINIDITGNKVREAEIFRLQHAVEQSPIMVMMTDLAGNITYVNAAFEATTGYSRDESLGKNPRFLKSGQLSDAFYKEMWDTITGGKEWRGELLNRKKNGGEYWEYMSVTPVHDHFGQITNFLAIKQDITLDKENEQKILDLNASLEVKIAERTAQLTEANDGLAREIEERKRKEAFELELLHISTQLTGIPASEISNAINLSLKRIGLFTGSDRTFIFEIDPGEETFSNTYEWNRYPELAPLKSEQHIPMSLFPMWWNELRQGRHLAIVDLDDLPDTWTSERELLKPFGDKSLLIFPMFAENRLIGYGGLASIKEKKEFGKDEINLLTIWSSMLSNLINNAHMELLLEQTRKNYETFFNTLDDFLWVIDNNGNIIHFNTTVLARLGYSPDELIGKSILMVHPAGRREEAGKVLSSLLSGASEHFSIPIISKSGLVIPVESKAIHGYWNGQQVIFKTSKDISQIKLSEEKFSTAFQANAAMMAISHFDNGKYVDVNNTFLEVLGYKREEVIGKSNRDLGLFVDQGLREKILSDLDASIPVRKIEVPMKTRSDELKIGLLSADIILLGDIKCLLTVSVDISDRKKMEEQLKAAQEEADRANIAKSEFLSRMSHELRTPMNSILGFAQLLEMGAHEPGQQKGIRHILKSGKHLLDLINEVLEISRIEAGKLSLSPEPIQISSIIQDMIEIVWPLAKDKNLSLDLIDSEANQLCVVADRQRLKQVLLNLINNAIKYNKEGGSIRIGTELMPGNSSGAIPVRISITDTGAGILPANIPKLFQPFERIGAEQSATEGTGLGLAVVKKLIDAMGGVVGVSSTIGEGSTFWIELPLTESPLKQLENQENFRDVAPSLVKKSGTILYIEDNLPNIELVEQILLAHCDHVKLISHQNGSEAVKIALTYQPDLILLDLNLPDIHGSSVISLLKSNEVTSKIPVIVISADATAQQVANLKRNGADEYLTKPLDVKEFVKIINNVIKN